METVIQTAFIDGHNVVIRGVGKMYYQEGLPIGITISRLESEGYKVSVLHIADELLKEGWKPERVLSRLKEEIADSVEIDLKHHLPLLQKFVNASYEDQREMIFQSLFSNVETGKKWLGDMFDKVSA